MYKSRIYNHGPVRDLLFKIKSETSNGSTNLLNSFINSLQDSPSVLEHRSFLKDIARNCKNNEIKIIINNFINKKDKQRKEQENIQNELGLINANNLSYLLIKKPTLYKQLKEIKEKGINLKFFNNPLQPIEIAFEEYLATGQYAFLNENGQYECLNLESHLNYFSIYQKLFKELQIEERMKTTPEYRRKNNTIFLFDKSFMKKACRKLKRKLKKDLKIIKKEIETLSDSSLYNSLIKGLEIVKKKMPKKIKEEKKAIIRGLPYKL